MLRVRGRITRVYVPLSGEGTHVKGYVGHGDAKWEEQVLQGVEMIKVFWFLTTFNLKQTNNDRTP